MEGLGTFFLAIFEREVIHPMGMLRDQRLPDVCCWAGAVCLALAAASCSRLTRCVWQDAVAVAAALLVLAGLAMLLLRLEKIPARGLKIMLLPVGAAMLARALCMDFASSDYQLYLFPWVVYYRASGGFRAIADELGDYNVPYLYILALISYLRGQALYPIKLVSILADVLLAWGGLRLVRAVRGRREADPAPPAAFALLLLLPTVIINSSYWAQCDAVYGALVLHAIASVLEGKNWSSAAMLGVAFCFKLQAIFLVPLWGVLLLAKRVRFRELFAFPAAYFVTILPALLLGKPLKDILGVYFKQMGEYTYALSFSAPSIYALLPVNVAFDGKLAPLLGIAAAFLLALALMGLGYRMRGRLDDRAVMDIAVVMAIGVPFFLPYMHERYFFLADVLTACWACVCRRHLPAAVLTVAASLYCYALFLFHVSDLRFTLFGLEFARFIGAAAMLAALLFSAAALMRTLRARAPDGPAGGGNLP